MSSLLKILQRFLNKAEEEADVPLVSSKDLTEEEIAVAQNFQNQFSLQFVNPALAVTALKHRSFLNMSNEPRVFSNERLEFLGDAVIDLVVTHFLYEKFPGETEGHLSKVKSILVSKPVMADIATEMQLGDLVLMNRGEEKTGGRRRKSILADAFEAIVGAIYLDLGMQEAQNFIYTYLLNDFKKIIHKGLYRNYKSILLEHAQGNGDGLPNYRVTQELGPDHSKEFVIEVWIGTEKLGDGRGKSKKLAEQEAAKMAVEKLKLDTE